MEILEILDFINSVQGMDFKALIIGGFFVTVIAVTGYNVFFKA